MDEPGLTLGTWRRELLGPALVVLVAVAIELVTRFVVRIPNPPALLLIVIVFAAFHGGVRSGLASAAIAWGYFVWVFSVPSHVFRYAPDDLTRVVVWAFVAPAMALVVGRLRTRAVAAERAASRESEQRFTKAFHASPVGVVLTRLSDGLILDANDAVLGTLGFDRTDLVGKTVLEQGVWRVPALRAELVERLRVDGRVRNVDIEARKKSGAVVHLLCSMEKVAVGADECMLTFAIDMTERTLAADALRRREEQLMQTQKMEAVGRLAGGIAHDFNNLLTVIGGNASLLAHTLSEQRSLEMVDEILHASERAASLTRQLLAFSRQEPLQPKPSDLGALVAKLEPFLRRGAPRPPRRASRCRHHPLARSRTVARLGHGTGLGLATVHGIVLRAEGFITVESAKGRGSAFGIYLPRLDEGAQEARRAD
ncbi:MAG TPA: PAS domain S-box protein [Polyangiaceae bacterium]